MSPTFDMDQKGDGPSPLYRLVPGGWKYAAINSVDVRHYEKDGEQRELWDVLFYCAEPGEEDAVAVRVPLFVSTKGIWLLKALLKALDRPHKGLIEIEAIELEGGVVALEVEQRADTWEKDGQSFSKMKMLPVNGNPFAAIAMLPHLQQKDQKIQKKLDEKAYQRREEERSGAPPKPPAQRDTGPAIDMDDVPF